MTGEMRNTEALIRKGGDKYRRRRRRQEDNMSQNV